jgi:Glycosyltransferase sugar-binding region containing DXD motif
MRLSVCLITADPPSRVAAILEPLRPLAEEVLIAADSRVEEETLAGYAALADRLFKIEYVLPERHLAWLCAQCSGEWILRLDGDEMPSQALIRRLPELLDSRSVRQYWIRRAWLYPDAKRILGGTPWSEDFVNRLTRNDGALRVSGLQHTDPEPVTPREYIEQPLYHLDLLTSSHQQRQDKVVCYEASRSRLLAAGGGRLNEAFYLPELRTSLELHPVPEEDRAAIVRAIDGSGRPARSSVEGVPFVPLAEMDRFWEGRTVGADAYRASIEPCDPSVSLTPSERRHIFVRVCNEGNERWPANLDEKPLIRLSYRWLNPDGSVQTPDGARSAFPRVVDPGECLLVPLHVDAPALAGEYVLEVDVVHEDVKWFGCACRVPVHVGPSRELPPSGGRLRETTPRRLRRWRRVRIPRTIHRVWLGDRSMPEEHERLGETFSHHHPGWEMRLWTDEDLPALGIGAEERERARSHSELSNLVRYEVLHCHGGVYVDTDVECRRTLTPLLRGIDTFAALEVDGVVGSAVLGSVSGHPVFARAARLARRTLGTGVHSPDANGPRFLSLILEQEPGVTIFAAGLFYPYLWDELDRRHETFPDAYAVHHWTLSWLVEGRQEL